jgi:hypothetical protein
VRILTIIMEEALLNVLHTTSFTVEDVYHRLGLVRRFFEQVYFSGSDVSETLEDFLTAVEVPADAAKALASWSRDWLADLDPSFFHERFEAVRERLQKIPTVMLSVPVALGVEEREAVGNWVRAHVATQGTAESRQGRLGVLVDLVVDPRAIGGCRIVVGGRYGDFSFRYFSEQNREQLIEALRHIKT